MVNNLSVYKQLTYGVRECQNAIKREIGMKATCNPFAVKLLSALSELNLKTEQDELNAANVLLSGLQTLMQGGIIAEDYDKIDFVNRGNTIVPSARVEAFYRACARKGYRITDTIVAVPAEDDATTYFREYFAGDDIVYVLEDKRINPDRAVTAKRLVDRYFSKFICRLEVREAKTNKRVVMTVCEISIDDLLKIAESSEQGIYKSRWEKYETKWGTKNRKVITDEINENTFWVKWTGEMVNKSVIRRALKRIKEVLPELTDSIYAFEQSDSVVSEEEIQNEVVIDVPVEYVDDDVKLTELSEQQQAECLELYELYKANPKLAEDKLIEIQADIAKGVSAQEIINRDYAAIICLKRSKAKWEKIGGYFNA